MNKTTKIVIEFWRLEIQFIKIIIDLIIWVKCDQHHFNNIHFCLNFATQVEHRQRNVNLNPKSTSLSNSK